MIKKGILNPHVASLLCRFRHTNAIVIADRGFPSSPLIETVDISLVDDVPTVLQVLEAITAACVVGEAHMASEFLEHNAKKTRDAFTRALDGVTLSHESHVDLKQRVPTAIGIIRTGDTTPYANIVLVSA
ncbi:MAG: RbsD/FucU family protein [Chloroflexi bacterium]|nr:RbsD/FucU family protein [Chloroflexota bacterium]